MEFVIVKLSGERYAVPITAAREIVPFKDLTRVPGADKVVVGITNIRGQVRAILDANVLLTGQQSPKENPSGYVLLTELDGSPYGVLFDSVDEVLTVPEEAVSKGSVKTAKGAVKLLNFDQAAPRVL